ncbi:MAG TPA: CFI-box-CTERM domain-containing protein [Allocoleopsis sp.]
MDQIGNTQSLPAIQVKPKPMQVSTGAPPMSSNNMVNIQFPTSIGGGGGMSFDFGPNTATLAEGAYNFLNASFANNNAFVSSAISGAQSFYGGLVKPSTDAASTQIEANTQILPQLYGSLLDTSRNAMQISERIAGNAMGAQERIAANTVREQSRAGRRSGKPKGFCFITTACCEFYGLPDDCRELETLRKYRDEYMMGHPEREPLVREYYSIAPEIVERIKARKDAAEIFDVFRNVYIIPAVECVESCKYDEALDIYKMLVSFARSVANE